MIDDLLIELKDKLQVTWDDEATNRYLAGLIKKGQSYFNALCGTKFSFEEDSPERELLLERCRYGWNNALDDFEKNFHSELSRLILITAMNEFSSGVADDNGTGTNSGSV
ncbi:hypothetical protein B5V89_05100 [Heyndrickxia sporothermodurans]|uniref:hypothetical protein n=1 Tax=Heyndrickxia sporothermodurans TaxID=46224 RepID=UPI000D38E0D0|nr:hypothetical protein [Heyndrickxia sporothermodurans]PTY79624.1 hypothetical protein B5V89_05100 [Heyndrickxia sporothermodurans]